ncbi:MAG TPA: putative glycoside hydrolase [Gemmatimonadales bacterium]
MTHSAVRALAVVTLILGGAAPAPAQRPDELPPPTRPLLPYPALRPAPEPRLLPAPPLKPPPDTVRALYVNAWVFGSARRFQELVRLAETTEVNALILDIKDDTGYLTYASRVPTAVAIGANRQLRAPDAAAKLRLLAEKGIHAIARIVVAKDPLLASGKPEWAIGRTGGGLWRDRQGSAWVDAYRDSVWIYAAELAAEAVQLGFGEVQYDYVRFPDEPKWRLASAVFTARRGEETEREGVARNLRLLAQLTRSLGVPFTIDVFGMTTSATNDMGIGQLWEDLVASADVVLPMVYPSHYYGGFYEFRKPNFEPYRVVKRALEDGLRRSAAVEGDAVIRPFLQAFTLGPPKYTPFHVREQIRAAEELGLHSWALWNPRSVYDRAIFRP